MLHQPLGGFSGQATDMEIHAKEILKLREKLNRMLAENTGKDVKHITKDTDRDFFMTPQEALDYGVIDKIVS